MPVLVTLDGHSLTIADVVAVARHGAPVAIAAAARKGIEASRRVVEEAVTRGDTIYGVNTGFGKLAHVRIPPDRIRALQLNLIRSHAWGVGEPLPVDAVRAMMLLRANVLVRGTSGVRPALPELIVAMLNRGVHPRVPSQGSVGASGDLAPLAHLALAMVGEGEDGQALRDAGLEPIALEAKEGLAFVNGTQAQTGLAALLVHDAWVLWRTAHGAAAMSLEAVRGTPEPFDARIHDARPHPLQQRSAALLRELLADSEIRESHRENDPRVQDAYSLRCTPQVLGAVGEALAFAERLVTVELNAATDNPLVFGRDVLSGGNFHGQPIALALDVLGIGLTTLAGLAERRLERIVNPDLSAGLPAFLAREPGVESGFMTAQIAAAALVAERPQDLVVYGGTGKAARDWPSFDAICRTLVALEDDEALLVQSGKPVGVFQTHPEAPRVLIANANLVGRWARWEVFRDLERRGLIMFGQMTAGSWIYIGTQGILQGTYETFGAVARRHFGGSLQGRLVLTGGLGGMGGAQPLAATIHGGGCLAAEADPAPLQRRRRPRYLDPSTASLDEALRLCRTAPRDGEALSVGLIGNCADVLPEL